MDIAYLHSFSQLTSEEQIISFLREKANNGQRTKGQVMFSSFKKEAMKTTGHISDFKNQNAFFDSYQRNLQDLLNQQLPCKEIQQLYLDELKTQQQQKQKAIMDEAEHLYHFSTVAPQNWQGDTLTPSANIDMHFEQNFDACFASPSLLSLYPLKLKDIDCLFCGFSEQENDKFALINCSKKDFLKQSKKSYGYEVDKNSFVPNVSLDGQYSGEFYSTSPASLINKDNPKIETLNTLEQKGIQIFFAENPQTFNHLRQKLNRFDIGKDKFEFLKQTAQDKKNGKYLCHYNNEKQIARTLQAQKSSKKQN